MRKITAFNFITLDGYFEGLNHDISWHRHGAEENDYAAQKLQTGNVLLFGRVTYEMMARYWPTPQAIEQEPTVAKAMNSAEKLVFSRTLQTPEWNNTRLLKDNIAEQMRAMKQTPGKDMTILGSGSIVALFTEQGLIDQYQILVDPVLLGAGTSLCKGIRHRPNLRLTTARTFRSGSTLLCFEVC